MDRLVVRTPAKQTPISGVLCERIYHPGACWRLKVNFGFGATAARLRDVEGMEAGTFCRPTKNGKDIKPPKLNAGASVRWYGWRAYG